jgi:CIC family chloride channel protein
LIFSEKSYLYKTKLIYLLLAVLVGLAVGLAVAILRWSVFNLAEFLITTSENFLPLNSEGDFLLVLVVGALIMGFFLKLAPNIAGPGIGDAMGDLSDRQAQGRFRCLPLKLVGTIICVGTGGGGLVGPGYFTGTRTSTFLGELLDLRDRRVKQILLLIGASAGVSAVLKSPIGGTLVALGALRSRKRDRFDVNQIVPSLLAGLSAYLTIGMLLGFSPLFHLEEPISMSWSLSMVVQMTIAALVAGGAAKAYIELFRGVRRLFKGKRYPWAQPALGALLASPVILFLSTGTSSAIQPFEIGRPGLAPLQDVLLGELGLWVIVSLTLGKAVDVALRSGSGGSVGIFSPAMWIGGLSGAMVDVLPGFQSTPLFAVTGIAAGIAAAMEFPLAAAVIVIEIFGGVVTVPSIAGSVMGALAWWGGNRLIRKEEQHP